MLSLFKNITYFTCLFISLIALDIYVKLNLDLIPYRFISKPLVMLSLIIFYLLNNKEVKKLRFNVMMLALVAYFIGNILLIIYKPITIYFTGILLFVVGKFFYAIRFSNQKDFQLFRLLPFLVFCFVYMIGIMYLILNSLKGYFIPTLIYLFSTMLVGLFALLRKDEVNIRSYYLVLFGIVAAIICDSLSVLQIFYSSKFLYPKVSIIIFYAISQYLIVIGIVEETNSTSSA